MFWDEALDPVALGDRSAVGWSVFHRDRAS
jgi:hypothetical protein